NRGDPQLQNESLRGVKADPRFGPRDDQQLNHTGNNSKPKWQIRQHDCPTFRNPETIDDVPARLLKDWNRRRLVNSRRWSRWRLIDFCCRDTRRLISHFWFWRRRNKNRRVRSELVVDVSRGSFSL